MTEPVDTTQPDSDNRFMSVGAAIGAGIGAYLVMKTLPSGGFQIPWSVLKDILDMSLVVAGAGVGSIFGIVFGALLTPKVKEANKNQSDRMVDIVRHRMH